MAANCRTEEDLWDTLRGLDDDLLDVSLPESAVDAELKALGIDPVALATKGSEFVARAKEEERLSWQARAREERATLQRLAANSTTRVLPNTPRKEILARLEALRMNDANVGPAIKMAARKRKPEESTDEELRALLEEMEALRSIEDNDEE